MTDAERLRELAEQVGAHGSHWRQPYQAYCYDVQDALRAIADRLEKREMQVTGVLEHLKEYRSGKRPYVDVRWCEIELEAERGE